VEEVDTKVQKDIIKSMANQNSKTLTLPKSAIRGKEGIVILPLKRWEKIKKENQELRLAVEAIISGELARQKNQTRSFREFLKSEFPQYAKNFLIPYYSLF